MGEASPIELYVNVGHVEVRDEKLGASHLGNEYLYSAKG
jgi:hypothetical protein